MTPEVYRLLKDRLENSKGYAYLKRIESLERSIHIFVLNFEELQHSLNHVEGKDGDPVTLWIEENREQLNLAHLEVVRRLHNFVAASQTLVEHTRKFMRKWHETDSVHKVYQSKVKSEFSANPTARFVQDLRNYFLHNGIPPSSLRLTSDVDSGAVPTSKIFLNRIKLLEWSKWSKESEIFLANADSLIDLRAIVSDYNKTVYEFHLWFKETLNVLHASELQEYAYLRKQIFIFNWFDSQPGFLSRLPIKYV